MSSKSLSNAGINISINPRINLLDVWWCHPALKKETISEVIKCDCVCLIRASLSIPVGKYKRPRRAFSDEHKQAGSRHMIIAPLAKLGTDKLA